VAVTFAVTDAARRQRLVALGRAQARQQGRHDHDWPAEIKRESDVFSANWGDTGSACRWRA